MPLTAVLLVSSAGFTAFYVLLAVIPVLASRSGGRFGAGVATAVFMTATVAVQTVTPRLLRVLRPHVLLAASLILLGAPALLYPVAGSLFPVLLITAARGGGFGLLTVVGTGLVSSLAAPGRRGSALGIYGLSTSTTGIIAPAIGLLLFGSEAPDTAYWADAAIPLVALLLVPVVARAVLPTARPTDVPDLQQAPTAGVSMWRDRRFWLPLGVFFPCAVAYGGTYTFVPLLHRDSAAAALFAFGIGFALARFMSGRLADRVGSSVLVRPLLAVAFTGTLAIPFSDGPLLSVVAVMAGTGVGGLATVSLLRIMNSVPEDDNAGGSAMWNLTFDVGIGFGGLGLGIVAQALGTSSAFGFSAGGLIVAFLISLLMRTTDRGP